MLFIALIVGCRGDASSRAKADVAASIAHVVQPSAGCGKVAADPSPHAVTLRVADLDRSFDLSLPPAYDARRPYALVLGFHGSGSSGTSLRDYMDMERSAKEDAIFAYPDGLEVSEGGTGWHLRADGRDVAFVEAMVARLEADYCVDRAALFAVGFSYGGWMANALACSRPGLLRGIASIAGGGPTTACSAGVGAIIIHGSGDFNEPLGSGEDSRDRWRKANGCSKEVTSASPCVAYRECALPLYWCRHDGGHDVPAFAHDGLWPLLARL